MIENEIKSVFYDEEDFILIGNKILKIKLYRENCTFSNIYFGKKLRLWVHGETPGLGQGVYIYQDCEAQVSILYAKNIIHTYDFYIRTDNNDIYKLEKLQILKNNDITKSLYEELKRNEFIQGS